MFNKYQHVYELSSWNTYEIGEVVRGFSETLGSIDNAYLGGFPYWVDSRLVAINAGYSTGDLALWPEHFQYTLADERGGQVLNATVD